MLYGGFRGPKLIPQDVERRIVSWAIVRKIAQEFKKGMFLTFVLRIQNIEIIGLIILIYYLAFAMDTEAK